MSSVEIGKFNGIIYSKQNSVSCIRFSAEVKLCGFDKLINLNYDGFSFLSCCFMTVEPS
jgi:hypothetical protein